jgi:hypothetical protein
MGSWDCYCSICGGPLKAQSVRKQDDDVDKASQHDGADGQDVDEEDDEGQEGEDSELPRQSTGVSEDDDDDGVSDSGSADGDDEEEDDDDEEDDEDDDGYDPRIVQSKDVEWTGDCRILGFNAEASGVSKYVSAELTPPSTTCRKIAMY